MRTAPKFGFVIEYVKDIDAATRFYVDVLGIQPERTHPTFVQFETFALATDAPIGGRGEDELYWLVDDIEAAFNKMSKQAEVSLPLKQMPFGTLFGINDPEGRPRYVLQLATDRPSRPTEARG